MRAAVAWLSICSMGWAPATSPAQLVERPLESDSAPGSTAGLVDEDEDLLPQTEYVFNPIQARKDVKIGDFYARKGSHRAAVARYLEATKWHPQYAEAYLKLARSREQLSQPAEALDAYRSFLGLEEKGKKAAQARRRVAALEKLEEQLPLAAGKGPQDRGAQKPTSDDSAP